MRFKFLVITLVTDSNFLKSKVRSLTNLDKEIEAKLHRKSVHGKLSIPAKL